MTAVMSGGTIPDTGDYSVVLEPQALMIGTVNEDFAIESLAGDIFQLGNASYRIIRVEAGRVRVEDAQGMPPTIPFWLGEAPGRTDELSIGVSRLRADIAGLLEQGPLEAGVDRAITWLVEDVGLDEAAARQLVDYFARQQSSLGLLPTQQTLAMERFFDESGGTQLVIHSPYGSRVNRAWGLALRKRFCRKFNFELQAAATEDAIVLSLSTSHSFPLIEVAHYLHSNSACDVLVQALLDAPLFGVRWRWNATTALALPRFQGGKKVAPQLQRMKSEDLLASVFPDQVACAENLVGEREVPDHPLVAQTLDDCLHEAMDTEGWLALLRRLESGEVQIVARDLTAPSPFAAEALNARPYAFLDDAPLEERRTQAVMSRRYADNDSAGDLGRLDPDAIETVREQAWPRARNVDEMHDALMGLGCVTAQEALANDGWPDLLRRLAKDHRATRIDVGASLWFAAERLPQAQVLHPGVKHSPAIEAPAEFALKPWSRDDALVELLRSRLTGLGPTTAMTLSDALALPQLDIDMALMKLEGEGYVMRGRFTAGAQVDEWCERHLLARIHRYTIGRLRKEIEPVAAHDFMRFLFDWQRVSKATRVSGPEALVGVLAQLEGFEAPAGAWEGELLPARVSDYSISWLDDLCTAGRITWTRLRGAPADTTGSGPVRATPIALLPRRQLALWTNVTAGQRDDQGPLSSRAEKVVESLREHGASFFDELVGDTHLLRTEMEDALAELVARGRVHCDSFAGLRALLVPASKRPSPFARRGRRAALFGIEDAGRWTLARSARLADDNGQKPRLEPEAIEHIARTLLRRYGVVCWRLLEREAAWLPSWRELLRVYHRLEARGEIRGGRFIAGLSGEQFALPEAVGALRHVRRQAPDGALLALSASDPLNLVGTVLPGSKVPRLPGARVLYRDGIALGALVAGNVELLTALSPQEERDVRRILLREPESQLASPAVARIDS
jgi:ATP-dependent Lhr-like helicase